MPKFLPDPNIPKVLYDALIDSETRYRGDLRDFLDQRGFKGFAISTTASIGSPRKYQLQRRHREDIVVDPLKDLWHSMIGSIVHNILENHAKKNPRYLVEHRAGARLKVAGEKVLLHGQADLYNKKTGDLDDWKFTRASSMLYDKDPHMIQLNILRYLFKAEKMKVRKMRNVYLFPHLDKREFSKEWYPKRNAMVIVQPSMEEEFLRPYIFKRVRLHLEADATSNDSKLADCTDEEKWVRNGSAKVYLRKVVGKKRTGEFSTRKTKEFPTEEEAEKWGMENHGEDNYKVVFEKSAPNFCLEFCPVADFCNTHQDYLKKNQDKLPFKRTPEIPLF